MTAGTPVTSRESKHGRLELARRQPDPRLRGDVVRLTGDAEFMSTSARYHEPPPTFVAVIVNVGTPYRVLDPADRRAATEQQLFRFNRSLKLLESGAAGADVAFQCGYADQAHFVNEFRRFSGSAPGAFMREPQVQFLQDASEQAA